MSSGAPVRTFQAPARVGCTHEGFLAEGQVAQVAGFAHNRLDISDFPSRHPCGLNLWQKHIERVLGGWVAELPVTVHRGREVTGIAQDGAGVDVELSDGGTLHADYVAGCDGGRSLIRKAAGIGFPGWDPTTSSLIAEVEMAQEPDWGIHSFGRLEYGIRDGEVVYKDEGPVGVMVTEERRARQLRAHTAARACPPGWRGSGTEVVDRTHGESDALADSPS